MIKYENDGLVTDEIIIAAMFIGGQVSVQGSQGQWMPITMTPNTLGQVFLIPWPLVKAATDAMEGKAVFDWDDDWENYEAPRYIVEHYAGDYGTDQRVRACPLTTSKYIGELRDLLSHFQGVRG